MLLSAHIPHTCIWTRSVNYMGLIHPKPDARLASSFLFTKAGEDEILSKISVSNQPRFAVTGAGSVPK